MTSGTPVFQFMNIRSPQAITEKAIRKYYVKDEVYLKGVKSSREFLTKKSDSKIGALLFNRIICDTSNQDIRTKNLHLSYETLELLEKITIACDDRSGTITSSLNEFEHRPLISHNNAYYVLKTRIEDINCEFDKHKLITTRSLIEKHIRQYNRRLLLEDLRILFDVELLTEVVYQDGSYHPAYQQIRDIFFDNLYTHYVLRRIASINMEELISGLQTLHTLEFLAIEDLLDGIKNRNVDPNSSDVQQLLQALDAIHPDLGLIRLNRAASRSYIWIKNAETLNLFYQSIPIIHPLVARLHWYKKSFNAIKPIGIGDLKVVKQSLVGYKLGEISHIHNIMKGELKDRVHRKLEKSEDTYNFFNEQASDSQNEHQSTDRFELKKEAESVIKTDINVGANANFTYKNDGMGITTSVGGNFAYSTSKQDTEKTASNYAREVMDKAITNIQSRATQSRTVTRIVETEETNKHTFSNIGDSATHTSGIYRWLDKKYKAQLYNYGKRLMFEFIIPEPAAFYVMSKLKAAEFDLTIPVKPEEPEYDSVEIRVPGTATTLLPADITPEVFNELRKVYDLSEFSYPQITMSWPFSDPEKKNNLVVDTAGAGDQVWTNNQYTSKIPKGYNVASVSIVGNAHFLGKEGAELGMENANNSFEDNKWLIMLNGVNIWDERDGSKNVYENHILDNLIELPSPIIATPGDITLDINFQDLKKYFITVYLGLKIDDNYLLDWKSGVYNKIRSIELQTLEQKNQEIQTAYRTALANYQDKLKELQALVVNDLIQGRSEAANRLVIKEELKKHCLTMIAREFDTIKGDDILSELDAMKDREVDITYEKFYMGKEPGGIELGMSMNDNQKMIAAFVDIPAKANYPKIDIEAAQQKGKFIQFLEQSFEWENIAYIFYPYFWAAEKKWIKLMNRLDYTDDNMTAFLKAGSVRVLVAVTPAYNDAVMHFLETREPWEGGQLPVIGDPLFIPIHEEIRKQQDDLNGAVAEGDPWEFELPTSLVYLQGSTTSIPTELASPQ